MLFRSKNLRISEWFKEMSDAVNVKYAKMGAEALYELALGHYHGDGATQDFDEAFSLMMQSAEKGYAAAQNSVAVMHENGYGTEVNLVKAVEFYLKAVGQG